MLYPIWLPMPRPPHFPQDTTLDRLLAGGYDPNIRPFKLSLWRREARDLAEGPVRLQRFKGRAEILR
jgi:hypothetical protein